LRLPGSPLFPYTTLFRSEVDTLLAVYTGTTLATLAEVASNDDSSFGVTTSRLTFNSVSGTTYQIAVDAYEAEEGQVRLTILENRSEEHTSELQSPYDLVC